jgi:hypothetical protein
MEPHGLLQGGDSREDPALSECSLSPSLPLSLTHSGQSRTDFCRATRMKIPPPHTGPSRTKPPRDQRRGAAVYQRRHPTRLRLASDGNSAIYRLPRP